MRTLGPSLASLAQSSWSLLSNALGGVGLHQWRRSLMEWEKQLLEQLHLKIISARPRKDFSNGWLCRHGWKGDIQPMTHTYSCKGWGTHKISSFFHLCGKQRDLLSLLLLLEELCWIKFKLRRLWWKGMLLGNDNLLSLFCIWEQESSMHVLFSCRF